MVRLGVKMRRVCLRMKRTTSRFFFCFIRLRFVRALDFMNAVMQKGGILIHYTLHLMFTAKRSASMN